MGIDRKHVLIACAIAGAVLGLVLAVLQAAGQHRRVVEMRAALEAEESAQTEGYTRSLEELRWVLKRRDVRFSLDIAPDGATLAVQVSEDEGVA